MDDLNGLEQMRSELSGPSREALDAARTRLRERMAAPDATVVGTRRRKYRRASMGKLTGTTARRASISLVGVAAVAATVFTLAGGRADPPKPSPSPLAVGVSSASAQKSVSQPPAPTSVIHYINASQVLDTASAQALSTPWLTAGQYTHLRDHQLHVTQNGQPPADGSYEFIEDLDNSWTPAEASSPEYKLVNDAISVHYPSAQQRLYDLRSGGTPQRDTGWYVVDALGNATSLTNPGAVQAPCSNCADFSNPLDYATRANLVHLADNPVQLRKDLFAYASSQNKEATENGKSTLVNSLALHTLNGLLTFPSLTAAQRAALYQVAKTIPGIKLTGSMANYDGVRGTGIGLTNTWGVTQSLIFSATGVYLGEKEVLTAGPTAQYQLPTGTVLAWSAETFTTTGKPKLPRA